MAGFQKKDSYYAWRASKNDSEAVKQACARLKTAAGLWGAQPPVCKHNARMVGFIEKLTCCQASLHKRGVGGAQPPSACKHTARMVRGGGGRGGGAKRLILQGGFQKRLKTAGGGGEGLGADTLPAFANTMLAWSVIIPLPPSSAQEPRDQTPEDQRTKGPEDQGPEDQRTSEPGLAKPSTNPNLAKPLKEKTRDRGFAANNSTVAGHSGSTKNQEGSKTN